MLFPELEKLKEQLEKNEDIEVDKFKLLEELNLLDEAKPADAEIRSIDPGSNKNLDKVWFNVIKRKKDGYYDIEFVVNPNEFTKPIPEELHSILL